MNYELCFCIVKRKDCSTTQVSSPSYGFLWVLEIFQVLQLYCDIFKFRTVLEFGTGYLKVLPFSTIFLFINHGNTCRLSKKKKAFSSLKIAPKG